MGAILVKAPIKPPEIDWRKNDWQEREADYVATLAELAGKQYSGDTVGEVVRWQRADGYAQYMVLSEKPLRLVHLDLGDGYGVEAALLRGLTLATVQGMVQRERALRDLFTSSNSIYDTLEPGAIVHYDNSFNQFVRCEAVAVPPGWQSRVGSKPEGKVVLKPIALVGLMRHQDENGQWVQGWSDYDLFRRLPDGSVQHGYHAEMVLEGELFQPNGANLFESPEYKRRGGIDPREMEPLSLEPPPMTTAQERIVPLAQAMQAIGLIVNDSALPYTEDVLRLNLDTIPNIALNASKHKGTP